ncbi:MAG TPA: biotin/lipoyl-containing protein [Candidatus Binatia bacterium]|jgi:3-methylcrotonyl-CoA carboxylase alpha subunit|nr:biotin/lipoyl-containing protein [Candidatus Binatia bacterium]
METRLRIGDRTLVVTLDADTARVDDRTLAVVRPEPGPVTTTGGWTVEDMTVTVDGRPRRAVVARRSDRVLVSLDGRVHAFALGDAERRAAGGGAGSGSVTAPMPGKVVRVLVAVGDVVETGQALVVLEAMKMETTLAAEVAGTVKAVHAEAGGMVDAGAVIVEIA